jgi:hypothetical protein
VTQFIHWQSPVVKFQAGDRNLSVETLGKRFTANGIFLWSGIQKYHLKVRLQTLYQTTELLETWNAMCHNLNDTKFEFHISICIGFK